MKKTISFSSTTLSLMDAAVIELERRGYKKAQFHATTLGKYWQSGRSLASTPEELTAGVYIVLNTEGEMSIHAKGNKFQYPHYDLPVQWDLLMKETNSDLVTDKWLGKVVRLDSTDNSYSIYDLMFKSMGFKNEKSNPRGTVGTLYRVFAVAPHEGGHKYHTGGPVKMLAGLRALDGTEVLVTIPQDNETLKNISIVGGIEAVDFLRLENKEYRKGEFVTCLPGFNSVDGKSDDERGGLGYIPGMTFKVDHITKYSTGDVVWVQRGSAALPKEFNGNGIFSRAVRVATEAEIEAYKAKDIVEIVIKAGGNDVKVRPGMSIQAVGVGEIPYENLSRMLLELSESRGMNGWAVSVTHVNIGCWKNVSLESIQEIVNAYNRK